jgi:CheY-like chemotaxis protein
MERTILYVEDNPDDVTLMTLAFKKAGVDAKLQVASDGDQAISTIQAMDPASLPSCVLLDIKLPRVSGLEVLKWIRDQPRFKRMLVIMLTSSMLPSDINKAYDLCANSYLIKPSDHESLIRLAKIINDYWLHTNIPPVEMGDAENRPAPASTPKPAQFR